MHAHQLRLLLSAIVLLSLVLGPLSHVVSAAPRVSYVTTPGDDSWPEIPTKASMVRVSKDLPNDPIAAAEALVRKIYDPNELLARSATAELLRRAGIPVYASDGQPVRDPDKYVLRDIVINDVSLIVLTRDTRLNDFYSPKQLETLLVGMHILKKGFPVRILIETLGQWGKGPKAPVESKVAGAAVRTLSGRRGQLFYSGADPKSLRIDPLQTIIVMAHSASRTTDVAHKRTGKTAGLGSPVRQKDVGPCNAFANSLLSYPLYGPVKDLLKKEFTDQLKKIAKGKYEKQIGNAADAYDILTDLAGALLTILGAQITVTADKYQTHFKHRAGSTKEEVTVKAETAFSSFLSDNFRSCLRLAGVDTPRDGPMKGFRVSWRIYQDKENYTNYGWPGQPNPFPLIHGGKYLTTFRSDADKLERTGGTGGVVLGKSGATSIHLYPPVEKHPGKGAILYGNVKVVAVLNSKDNPSVFGITDPISFKEWAEKEAEEIPKEAYRWAVLKTLSNAIKVLKDVGLPNRAVNITVSYHGNDIYTVKGDTNLWLFYVALPISLDMYTCDGLRNGVWKGKGGIKKWDVTVYGDLLASIVGDKIPHNVSNWNDHLKIPLSPSDDNLSVWQYSPFDIAPDFKLQGLMTITSPPREQFVQVEGNRKVAEQHQNGVVGNVLLVMNGQSLDRLALLLGGLSTAKYPVVGVKSYPKCKGGGPDDYYYENR